MALFQPLKYKRDLKNAQHFAFMGFTAAKIVAKLAELVTAFGIEDKFYMIVRASEIIAQRTAADDQRDRFYSRLHRLILAWAGSGMAQLDEAATELEKPFNLYKLKVNAQMDEDCMTVLLENNYTEQLLYYDENAYSYIYSRTHELIDHAFANSTMATQITGAAVWHTNTSASYGNRYSDHDAVMVGLRLGEEEQGISNDNADVNATKILRDGQLIIIRGGVEYTLTGQPVR